MKRGHAVLRRLALAGLGLIVVAFWLEKQLEKRPRRYEAVASGRWVSVPGDYPPGPTPPVDSRPLSDRGGTGVYARVATFQGDPANIDAGSIKSEAVLKALGRLGSKGRR